MAYIFDTTISCKNLSKKEKEFVETISIKVNEETLIKDSFSASMLIFDKFKQCTSDPNAHFAITGKRTFDKKLN